MTIYLIEAREDLPLDNDPWEPWYDKNRAVVVIAESELEARQMAHEEGAYENYELSLGKKHLRNLGPWLDSFYSTCKIITGKEESQVVIIDHMRA